MDDILDHDHKPRSTKAILLPILRLVIILYMFYSVAVRFYAMYTGSLAENYLALMFGTILFCIPIYYNASMAENEYYQECRNSVSVVVTLASVLLMGYLLAFINARSISRLVQVGEYQFSMSLAVFVIIVSLILITTDMSYLIRKWNKELH